MITQQKMMGFESPSDQKVPIRVGDWNALKLAVWRSRVGWGIAEHAALEVLERCKHVDGCPGKDDETAPCVGGFALDAYRKKPRGFWGRIWNKISRRTARSCPDREMRMSALVILNAVRTCAPADARRPSDDAYFAPSREYFSEVIAKLSAAQIELEATHEALRRAGMALPAPPPNEEELTPEEPVSTTNEIEEKTT